MGMLVDGEWRKEERIGKTEQGRFVRKDSGFRSWVTRDNSPGPTGEGGFAAAGERYRLYVSYACPWAHRALIYRKLKGLEDIVGLSVVHWYMGEHGWSFDAGEGVIPDPMMGARYLHEVYQAADPGYTGRVTVPVLWDRATRTIVNNESSEIIRMFNDAFDEVGAAAGDYYPEPLRDEIDRLNDRIYETVNNGVYKAGFATAQEAYEEAVEPLFETLDFLEQRLASRRYLCGDSPTEADWRLLTTLLRFDPVYNGHFKCNRRRLVDYPHLWGYTRDLYRHPGVAETCRFDHIKRHYYQSQTSVNPSGVVPVGPELDFGAPHGRGPSRRSGVSGKASPGRGSSE